jgi:hypothetical protein
LEIYPRNTDSRTTLKYTKYQLLYILIRTTVDINFAFALFIKELSQDWEVFSLIDFLTQAEFPMAKHNLYFDQPLLKLIINYLKCL